MSTIDCFLYQSDSTISIRCPGCSPCNLFRILSRISFNGSHIIGPSWQSSHGFRIIVTSWQSSQSFSRILCRNMASHCTVNAANTTNKIAKVLINFILNFWFVFLITSWKKSCKLITDQWNSRLFIHKFCVSTWCQNSWQWLRKAHTITKFS